MTKLNRDYETYSEVDIKKVGGYEYVRHPSTEALMLGWAFDDDTPQLWDIHGGEPMPRDLEDGYRDPSVELWAFNAAFERGVDWHVMKHRLPLERYRCTMVLGYSLSLGGQIDKPGGGVASGLEGMLLEMGAPEEYWKDDSGKALIRKFSVPQPKSYKVRRWVGSLENYRHDITNRAAIAGRDDPIEYLLEGISEDPEGYRRFCGYCRQDVVAERWLRDRLLAYNTMTDYDWHLWHLDQRINERGIPVDSDLVSTVLAAVTAEKADLKRQLAKMTGLDNPNSRDQMLGWLRDHGADLPDLAKATVTKFVKGHANG